MMLSLAVVPVFADEELTSAVYEETGKSGGYI